VTCQLCWYEIRRQRKARAGKKEGDWVEGIFALLRFKLERFRFSLIKRKAKQKIFQILLKEKNGGRKKLKKCIEKISVLVRRSEAEAGGNAPIELPRSTSVRLGLEPPRAPRVVSQCSVQKRLEFQPKGTANLEFQRFVFTNNFLKERLELQNKDSISSTIRS